MKKFWIVLSVCWLWTCSGGGDKATGPEEQPIVVNLTSLTGQAQKGPFNNGTSINVAELSNTLSPTGRNFSSAITDNTGRFAVANVQLESPFVELRATGFYFNEVSNNISDAQLTLYALSDLTNKSSLNVNILTHLEKNRMQVLMSGDNPKTFAQAKLQAQEEVLAIFDYSRANMPASELLDISQGGAANAKLLAISAILQGDQTVGQMSELLANISTDLSSDGTLDDSNLQSQLITNTQGLDFAEIRSNLSARFTALGITATIPDFETEINQFLKPPVAQDMSASTGEDTPINITLAASDPEGESLTYTILEVNNATVTLNGNVATYTPNAHFNGTDTFTFYANDGTSDSNTATVTMTVSAEDDEPNTLDVATTTDEDVAVTVNLSAEEYDGDSYSFAIVTDVSNGTTSLNGSTVTYSPNQDFNGEDTFTFEATDDTGRTINVATATITVNAVNDAPVANDITNQVTNENRMMQLDIALDATDVDGDALTYNITSTNNGSVTINDNIATYVPTQDWNGEDTFTYVANDGSLDSNTATVTITVNSVNDAPVISSSSFELDEDSTTADGIEIGHSFVTDVDETTDGSIFSGKVILVTAPENGSLSQIGGTVILDVGSEVISGNSVKYHPNQNYNGTDSFTWKANDGLLDSNIATVTITVNPVNDAPFAPDMTIDMVEDGTGQFIISSAASDANFFRINATDIENDALTFQTISVNNATYVLVDNNNELAYYPNQDFNGQDTFQYTVSDGTYESNTGTITVNISGVNDAPVTSNITQTQDEDNSEASDLSSFTSDVDGDDLTYSIVTDATNGTTSIDGSIVTYTPNANFHGTDSYTYKANDGTFDSNTSTVTVTVAAINDAPVTTDISATTDENTAVNITLDATDVEGDDLTYVLVSEGNNGTAGITNDILTYTPNQDWYGTTTLLYKANDGTDNSNTSTVTVTVIPGSFSVVVGTSSNDFPQGMTVTSDGGVAVAGYAGEQVYVVKFDDGGATEWEYIGSSSNYGTAIIETLDGGLAISGTSTDGSSKHLVKLSASGSVVFSNNYLAKSAWDHGTYSLREDSAGNLYIAGYEKVDDDRDGSLTKFDSNGNLLWNKTYRKYSKNNEYIQDIIFNSDQSITAVGFGQNAFNNEWMFNVDTSGNESNMTFVDLAGLPKRAELLSNGNIQVVSSYNNEIKITEVSSNFSFVDGVVLSVNAGVYLFAAKSTSDGGYIAAGRLNDSSTSSVNDGYFIKYDSSGTAEITKNFSTSLIDLFKEVDTIPSGGYYFAGWVEGADNDYDFYVVKVDAQGNRIF
jgi:hypothetical protein